MSKHKLCQTRRLCQNVDYVLGVVYVKNVDYVLGVVYVKKRRLCLGVVEV